MIHKYKCNGYQIAIDVNSSSVHVIDDITWDMLDCYEGHTEDEVVGFLQGKYTEEELRSCYLELKALEDRQMLFTPDLYQERVIQENREYHTKALCLNIAHDCNMRCGYCFASTGDYHGGRKLMPLEIAKKAIDFLLETSGNRKNLEVDFFGGEPLMNFDVVKQTVSYAKEKEKEYGKHISFTTTTNATLLDDDSIRFINAHMKNVVLSVDGRKEVNDKMRKGPHGEGTFDEVMPKIKRLVESRGDKSYYVRGTFTADNLDFVNDVLFLADQGFKEVSVEPVVLPDTSRYAIKKEHLPKIFEQYDQLAREIIRRREEGKDFHFYHYMIDLDGGPCVYKRVTACGSGVEYFAISPDGEIYPCHQFVGEPEYLLGTLDTGITNQEMVKKFSENTVYHKEKCQDCWAKFHCSGGCRANASHYSGDLKVPYEMECELQKKRTECAIMVKVHELLQESTTER